MKMCQRQTLFNTTNTNRMTQEETIMIKCTNVKSLEDNRAALVLEKNYNVFLSFLHKCLHKHNSNLCLFSRHLTGSSTICLKPDHYTELWLDLNNRMWKETWDRCYNHCTSFWLNLFIFVSSGNTPLSPQTGNLQEVMVSVQSRLLWVRTNYVIIKVYWLICMALVLK